VPDLNAVMMVRVSGDVTPAQNKIEERVA
jgi:hypothetical protein